MGSDSNKFDPRLHAKRLGRELAMQFMFQQDLTGDEEFTLHWQRFLNQAVEEHGLKENRFSRKGIEYAEYLVNGIREHHEEVDSTISEKADKWDFKRMANVDRNVMRVAAFEMLFVAEVPPVVSINEAVEIARDYSGEKAGNFINGVLNGIKDSLDRPARKAVKEL
ncbi:transcription antitermination factor NusB [Lentisphaerota bacterium ZTH]|nr:transcription antitermination factor NusB [Lentisphaerota bacterium]WET06253.1 transcription antitermination factor NusB [Lentisphaerota bacterium ZTH]